MSYTNIGTHSKAANNRMRAPTSFCPHCKSKATIATSKSVSPILRELRYACSNSECGHIYIAWLQTVFTLSPSAIPNLQVAIPFSKRTQARMNTYAKHIERCGLLKDELI